jgi:pyruvate kinase
MLELEQHAAARLAELHHDFQTSGRNLLHYLALRRTDVRRLQDELVGHGLSSLGRSESHVMANINAVLDLLHQASDRSSAIPSECGLACNMQEGRALLESHTAALLGPTPRHRGVRIMVTMPSEAATDYVLVRELLARGMNCMRINCAHDDAAAWERMIHNLRRAEREIGESCKVLMDLGGPKLRTGQIAPGPAVLRWRPQRDAFGRITATARIWLTPKNAAEPAPAEADAALCVASTWLAKLVAGDRIQCQDARGSRRTLRVMARVGSSWWAECARTAYVTNGTTLHLQGRGRARSNRTLVEGVPSKEQTMLLHRGDTLLLTRSQEPGRPAVVDAEGRLLSPATVPCTLPEVFECVRPGERIWLDDGKIGGVIAAVNPDWVQVRITQARERGEKLAADKGINLPDSTLSTPSLTDKDRQDLPFVAQHADIVGYSFVRTPADVRELQEHLGRGPRQPGIVLKIETRAAFEHLPALLFSAMRSPRLGVMIARGDLAVECGWERLAEVQEEILWICEAAHVPVIWATQVLEGLAKDGVPSRAEITDAAMGERAECVMLNKGPYVLDAVRLLDDILRRMQDHQSKKRAMLRHLRLADGVLEP